MDNINTILTMLDRVVHESTSETDKLQTIEGLKRKLHGELPSEIFGNKDISKMWEYETAIYELRGKVDELGHRNSELETDLHSLKEQVSPIPVDGFYTLEQFMASLVRRLGRTYGWRCDYIEASKAPGLEEVDSATIQQWQIKKRVPVAFYDQIDRMKFSKRSGATNQDWSSDDYDYLTELYLNDPSKSNLYLAETCAARFQRQISENSIRGAIDRLRKHYHRLPPLRPGRRSTV